MKTKNLLYVMSLLICTLTLRADIISVNFAEREDQLILPEESAGLAGFEAQNFNNFIGDSGSGALVDQFGDPTPAALSYTSSNMWGDGSAGFETPDARLSRGYLDDGSTTAPYGVVISVSDVPYSMYTVIVYHATDNAIGYQDVTVNGQTKNCPTTERWGDLGQWVEGVNCLVFNGVSGDTLDIQVLSRSGDMRGSVAGFQIVSEFDELRTNYPEPSIGSDRVPIETTLEWTGPSAYDPLLYYVYVDPNRILVEDGDSNVYFSTTTDQTSQAVALENGTTYYWRVDAVDPNDGGNPVIYSGRTWWFTTIPAEVIVDQQPAGLTVVAGQSAEFSVSALNAESYQWYKDDVLLVDDGTISGAETAVLTIDDVQLADEGFYHCVVSNELPSSEVTAAAQLLTTRQVGWWKLDGSLADSIQQIYPEAPAHHGVSFDPNYVDGIDGQGVEFYGQAQDIVVIENSAEFYNFYPRGYTVSAWVNMPEKVGTPWGAFVCKQDRPDVGTWKGFVLTHNSSGQAVHTLRQSFGDLGSNTDVDDGGWHLVVGTYDADIKVGRIYVDGALRNEATHQGVPESSLSNLIFGAENLDATMSPYAGQLDDVRIWSYPLDAVEVAGLYVDFKQDETICIEYPEFDIAGPTGVGPEHRDCRVDIYDLAAFIQTWLNCNIVPDCIW